MPREGEVQRSDLACARDLVRHLAQSGKFSLAVAGYPETHRDARSPEADLSYLKEKIDAGAEAVFTQLFFDPELSFRFLERARKEGISCPIVPGIMPISSITQLDKFVSLCGASIPDIVRKRLSALVEDPEGVIEFGIDFATAQSEALLRNGAPGLHFYTINRTRQVEEIVRRLALRPGPSGN
jgi:methylenetetrahydrofolate reductase (NADPH)